MQRYREAFRKKVIPSYYSGHVHVAFFIIFELVTLFFIAPYVEWNLLSPIYILIGLFYGSTFTYFVHRFLLHSKIPGFKWAEKMHHWHHTFYPAYNMQYDHLSDIYMLFMPPWIQFLYFFVYSPILIFLLSFILPTAIVAHFAFAMILWYGIYEFAHWLEHRPANHFLMKFRPFAHIRHHHTVHHSKLQHEINFGIVETSWDYIFKTKL